MIAAAEPTTIDFGDPEFWQDPYPVLAAARRRSPIARNTRGELVLLSADDVDAAHSDPDFGQTGLAALTRLGVDDGPFRQWRSLTMAAHDDEIHQRLRGCVSRTFTPRRVERLRSRADEHAQHLLKVAAEREIFDVVADYAYDMPLWLICEFLGLPTSASGEIDHFLTGTEEMFTEPLTADRRERAEAGIVALGDWVKRLVSARSSHPQEDLVSDLLEAERAGQLSREELVALVVNVIGGAVGSSRAAIANALLELLRHPQQASWVLADRARLAPAVEECLRYHPPFRMGRKLVRGRTARFGPELEPGDMVVISVQAANRDPSRWSDPASFDVTRKPERHYSFGFGAHFCLGQALARLDVQESIWVFLRELPHARLLTKRPYRIPFTPDEQIAELRVAAR